MPAIDPAIGSPILDGLLPNGATGAITLGGITLALPYKLRFTSTLGTASANGADVSAGGVSVAGALATAAAPVSNVPTKTSTSTLSFTTTDANTWNGCEVWDSSGTPKRVLYGPSAPLGKAYNIGDILAVNSGNLSGSLS